MNDYLEEVVIDSESSQKSVKESEDSISKIDN